jgi:hypothetical protein
MFQSVLAFAGTLGALSPNALAILVGRLGLSLNSFSLDTIDSALSDVAGGVERYVEVRDYSGETNALLDSKMMMILS